MRNSGPLSDADSRAIIRLLGDVSAMETEISEQKVALMNGLCRLTNADSWAWATVCKIEADQNPVSSGFMTGGFSPEQFSKFQLALEHPDVAILNQGLTREFDKKKVHLTRLREQIDVQNHFPQSDVYPLFIAAGIEQVIMSIRPISPEVQTAVAIYRKPGQAPFTLRESRIAHIILSEVPWLHEIVLNQNLRHSVARLSARQRVALNLLLEGQDREQIARHLGISYETVNDHIKPVYRHFEIHSQPELIARFQKGDGGDVP